jgi:Family of unknown function (DUF6600)
VRRAPGADIAFDVAPRDTPRMVTHRRRGAIRSMSALLVLLASCAGPHGLFSARRVEESDFHLALDRWGSWYDVPGYGACWRPERAGDWRPFAYGKWAWTDEGWVWTTDDVWGALPYHYGRWLKVPDTGWVWVPGFEWAPAQVAWRVTADHVGWAPLPPEGSATDPGTWPKLDAWTFMPANRFAIAPVQRIDTESGAAAAARFEISRPVPPGDHPGSPPWGGPDHAWVQQVTGMDIPAIGIVRTIDPRDVAQAGSEPIAVFRERGPHVPPGGRSAEGATPPAASR